MYSLWNAEHMCMLASSPGSFREERKEPGIHCMRMRVIAAEFRGDKILSEYARIFMTSLTSATLVVAIWNGFLFVTTKRQKG